MAGLLKDKSRDIVADLPDTDEIRAELARLRGEVEALLGKAATDGASGLRRLHGEASGRLAHLIDDGEARFADARRGMGRELRLAERRAAAVVRERPVETVALALGVEIVLALLLRR